MLWKLRGEEREFIGTLAEELVRLWIEGVEAAKNALIKTFSLKLFYWLLAHDVLPDDAEDIIQNTWVRVLLYLHRFEDRGPGSFNAWFCKIAENESYRFMKWQHKHAHILHFEEVPDLEAPEPDNFNPWLILAVSRLPNKQRIATELCLKGLGPQDIAEVMETSVHRVYDNLWKARQRLKREFGLTPSRTQGNLRGVTP